MHRRPTGTRMAMGARAGALVTSVLLAASCGGGAGAASTDGALGDIGMGIQGPAGLEATVVAEGLVHVSALAYDADGRLWVATADAQAQGDDGVYVVAADGATPVEVVAGVVTPMGLLWIDDVLFVSSAAGVVAYEGFDGTAFASSRTIVEPPDGVGLLGGLALDGDGRIVLGISAPCDACVPDDPWSASVVSFQPDGSDLRVVASGIRAPVGLAWWPGDGSGDDGAGDGSGGALLVSMDQQDDLGDATPGDWLAVVDDGQDWGFPDCWGQEGTVCEGTPEPLAVLSVHAGASGVAVVTGGLGDGIGTAAVVAEWVTGDVLVVALDGTTPNTAAGAALDAVPLLTDFENPVAVGVAPGGALLVGDWSTGIIYRVTA
jgi:glucose/arabinose dehydrogenase